MAEPRWVPGMFVWRELMTDDVEAARRFYGALFGWTWEGQDAGADGTYWIASRDGRRVGGAMQKPAGLRFPSSWTSYVLVDDVDAATLRWAAEGGRILVAPEDIPGVGRFSAVADPWGAIVEPFRAIAGESAPPPPGGRPPAGTFCWETLVTPDPAAAVAFYGKVLGFGTGRSPNGEAIVFTVGHIEVADLQ